MRKLIVSIAYLGIMIASSIVGFTMLAGILSGVFEQKIASILGTVSFIFLILWAVYGVSRYHTG